MSIDHVALHRLRSDLSLRKLSQAEIDVCRTAAYGSEVPVEDGRTLDACVRLVELGLVHGATRPGCTSVSATSLLRDLRRAGLLAELGVEQ